MKKIIRITESDIHNIVKKTVNRVLNEMSPLRNPTIGSEDWFEDEINPNHSQVGQYDNMSSDFVNWANMNDKDNDYDETKSWDNHFKRIENDRSWGDFDREVAKNKRAQEISKSPFFPNFGKLPKRNPNIQPLLSKKVFFIYTKYLY